MPLPMPREGHTLAHGVLGAWHLPNPLRRHPPTHPLASAVKFAIRAVCGCIHAYAEASM